MHSHRVPGDRAASAMRFQVIGPAEPAQDRDRRVVHDAHPDARQAGWPKW